MTDPDPISPLGDTVHDAADLLALGLRDDVPDADTIAAALPGYDDFRPLGAGGMGGAWSARHVQLDRRVAIKVLRRELAAQPSFAERFAREARALAKLEHPGIVGVHDFGEVADAYYLVMEYVEGTDLRSLMRAGLTADRAFAIVPQLCDALQYAHDRGVVHRDIKPENILVGTDGSIKIADFGLAKLRDPGQPSATSLRVLGTPHYMAPEQIDHPEDIDHRADIFALGVVIYEMLTGQLPVGRFDPPSRVRAVDVRMDEVVLRSLEHDRERRYQHAREVKHRVAALRPAMAEEPRTRDDVDRRVAQERGRAERWGGRAAMFGLAYPILSGVRIGESGFGYRTRPNRFIEAALAVFVGWIVSLVLDLRRHRGTFRAAVVDVKLRAITTLGLCGFSVVVAGWGDYGAMGVSAVLALVFGHAAWTSAVERRIPARLILGPLWWTTRFEADGDVRS